MRMGLPPLAGVGRHRRRSARSSGSPRAWSCSRFRTINGRCSNRSTRETASGTSPRTHGYTSRRRRKPRRMERHSPSRRAVPLRSTCIALGFWYRAGGATLASAVVFNLVCYIVSVVAIILILPRQARRIGNLVLFSVSFSPALLMTSTQVLKDPFFVMLIVVGCVASLLILRYSRDTVSAPPSRLTAGVLIAAAAVAAMAGVRAYYALFVWIAVAGAFLVSIVTVRGRHPRQARGVRRAGAGIAVGRLRHGLGRVLHLLPGSHRANHRDQSLCPRADRTRYQASHLRVRRMSASWVPRWTRSGSGSSALVAAPTSSRARHST